MANPQPRRPLEEALESELVRFERAAARLWTIVGAVMIVFALAYAGAVAALLGLALTVMSASYLGWYLWLWWRLGKGPTGPVLEVVTVAAEIAMPWIATLLLVATRGADYAIGSWVPPFLFCGQIIGNTVQMRGRRALVNGIGGALVYPLLYFLMMQDQVPEDLASNLLFQPATQLTRGVSILLGGIAGLLCARALRNLIWRAEIVSRERDLYGKYRLLRKLASGGMGSVHEALYCPEGGFERRVAIKRIHPHLAEQPRFVEAFRREAALSSRLLHPNIVQVMDFGRVDDRYFLSMEYVDGASLADLVERARAADRELPAGLVGHLGREILAGLDHAHRVARSSEGTPLRVVHRDLCPQNVLVSRGGHVKITDFGVARALEDGGGAVTQTFLGHLGYVAPEQAGGEHELDERADLFPLGVMLWELLAGRPLFLRRGQGATINAVLRGEIPSIRELRPALDEAWEGFFERALARDPADRFDSAREMAAALDDIEQAREGDGGAALASLFELPEAPRDEEDGLETGASR